MTLACKVPPGEASPRLAARRGGSQGQATCSARPVQKTMGGWSSRPASQNWQADLTVNKRGSGRIEPTVGVGVHVGAGPLSESGRVGALLHLLHAFTPDGTPLGDCPCGRLDTPGNAAPTAIADAGRALGDAAGRERELSLGRRAARGPRGSAMPAANADRVRRRQRGGHLRVAGRGSRGRIEAPLSMASKMA